MITMKKFLEDTLKDLNDHPEADSVKGDCIVGFFLSAKATSKEPVVELNCSLRVSPTEAMTTEEQILFARRLKAEFLKVAEDLSLTPQYQK